MNSERANAFTPLLRRFTDEVARDLRETITLYHQVRNAHQQTIWSQPDAPERVNNHVADVIANEVTLPTFLPVLTALDKCQLALVRLETTIFDFPDIEWSRAHLSLREQVDLNRFLRAKQHFLENEDRVSNLFGNALANVFGGIVESLPTLPDDAESTSLSIPLYAAIPNLGDKIAEITSILVQPNLLDAGLFTEIQTTLYRNACKASGINDPDTSRRPIVTADESKLAPEQLVSQYLGGTPFYDLFHTPIPFELPFETRFSHQWIIGQPGTGKSTLLQNQIVEDLFLVADNKASVVVMESNRDLIKSIEGLEVFGTDGALEGRLLSIDLEDVEWPIALNLFDIGFANTETMEPRARVALNNTVLALYDYIFSSLFSAEMTSRQNTLFTFTIQLLLKIPGATLDTLVDLMQPKGLANFKQYLPMLSADARRFFEIKFDAAELNKTKTEVLDRLFAVKRNEILSNMFSSPKSKIDFYEELGKPQVILINVPQSLLQDDGVEIVGRFFLAMLLVAAQKRQLVPRDQRFPCFVYIDECQDFIRRDTKIPSILDQARKLNVGLILAHQRLGQMQPYVLDALYGSTAIKFAAQVSDVGAHALARDMRTTPEFIMSQPRFHFAAYVRGLTQNAVSLKVPHVDLSKSKRMSADDKRVHRQLMRDRYAVSLKSLSAPPETVPISEVSPAPAPIASPAPIPPAKPKKKPSDDDFADRY